MLATLKQLAKVEKLIRQKKIPVERLQAALASGFLPDLLDENAIIGANTREEFCRAIGFGHLAIDYNQPLGIHLNTGKLNVPNEPERNDTVFVDISKIELVPLPMAIGSSDNWKEALAHFESMGKLPLDAWVMSEFIKHREKIPEAWRESKIYFIGTLLQQYICWVYVNVPGHDGIHDVRSGIGHLTWSKGSELGGFDACWYWDLHLFHYPNLHYPIPADSLVACLPVG